MKKFVVVLVVSLTLTATPSFAFIEFTQNEFITATSLDPGLTQIGVQFTAGEHYRSYYPAIRYGLGALTEVGVRFGLTSAEFQAFQDKIGPGSKLGILGGIDVKYQLIKESEGVPIDLAVDLAFDTTGINNKNAIKLSFSTIVSRNFPLTEDDYMLAPYGGLEMGGLYGSAIPRDKTSLSAFAGLEWRLSQKFMFLLEVKGGASRLGGVGIRVEY